MKLQDIYRDLSKLGDDLVIFAVEPWTPDSEAMLLRSEPDGSVEKSNALGKYFLEVLVAREVLETGEERRLSDQDRLRLLIYYAENDAYPEWLYV
jgi:hypothetical protein